MNSSSTTLDNTSRADRALAFQAGVGRTPDTLLQVVWPLLFSGASFGTHGLSLRKTNKPLMLDA